MLVEMGPGSCVKEVLVGMGVVWRDGVYGAACVAVNQCVKEVGCMG